MSVRRRAVAVAAAALVVAGAGPALAQSFTTGEGDRFLLIMGAAGVGAALFLVIVLLAGHEGGRRARSAGQARPLRRCSRRRSVPYQEPFAPTVRASGRERGPEAGPARQHRVGARPGEHPAPTRRSDCWRARRRHPLGRVPGFFTVFCEMNISSASSTVALIPDARSLSNSRSLAVSAAAPSSRLGWRYSSRVASSDSASMRFLPSSTARMAAARSGSGVDFDRKPAAPATCARRRSSGPVCMVTTIAGASPAICRMAAIPPIVGISMSTSTTSGDLAATTSTSSLPSVAVPTTEMSGTPSRACDSP